MQNEIVLKEVDSNADVSDPVLEESSRWNLVWVVPMVALVLGVWMLWSHFTTKGVSVVVSFETAEEIFEGTTEVKCRSVSVGVVKSVELSEDLQSVLVTLDIEKESEHLLREGSRFWVVKPRISGASITGLSTLIQGSYVELDPGLENEEKRTEFVGLEKPPSTSMSVPGRRVVLVTDQAGMLNEGSAVYHRGFEVGRVESRSLSDDGESVRYDVFIQDDHMALVTTETRFWNTDGLDINAGVDGFQIRTPSLQAMVSGGVSFGAVGGSKVGTPVQDGHVFTLYNDQGSARSATFEPTQEVMLLFDQTVRGLGPDASVEYRGLIVGRVLDVSFDLISDPRGARIPVLIEIDTRTMNPGFVEEPNDHEEREFLDEIVERGLRASLKSSSLITGSLYVDLDYYPEAPAAKVGDVEEYWTLPTTSAGFAQLEAKVAAILDKLEALPIKSSLQSVASAAKEAETTIVQSRKTLEEVKAAVAAARATLEDPALRDLPTDVKKSLAGIEKTVNSLGPAGAVQGDLLRSLDELRAALRSFKQLAGTLEERPNSLLFGRDSSGNPRPRAPRR